jgi:hypothetical protein
VTRPCEIRRTDCGYRLIPLPAPWGAMATARTMRVPPSRWTSRRAPSSMPEALENGRPWMSFASRMPGTEVVRIATFPFRAMMLPGAALPDADEELTVFGSVAPGCIVEFDAGPGRLSIAF